MNRNIVVAISHNEYNDVLLNNKCLRYSMNRVQSKDHIIGFNEVNKINKICILNNGHDELALGY